MLYSYCFHILNLDKKIWAVNSEWNNIGTAAFVSKTACILLHNKQFFNDTIHENISMLWYMYEIQKDLKQDLSSLIFIPFLFYYLQDGFTYEYTSSAKSNLDKVFSPNWTLTHVRKYIPLISKNQQFKKNFLQVKWFFITASFFKCFLTDSLFHVQIDLNGHDRLGDFDSIDL